jgi:hypothetical protein
MNIPFWKIKDIFRRELEAYYKERYEENFKNWLLELTEKDIENMLEDLEDIHYYLEGA